jgi:hypothetical protein
MYPVEQLTNPNVIAQKRPQSLHGKVAFNIAANIRHPAAMGLWIAGKVLALRIRASGSFGFRSTDRNNARDYNDC